MDEAAFHQLRSRDPSTASRRELQAMLSELARLEAWAAAGRLACAARLARLDDEIAAQNAVRAATRCSVRAAKRAVNTAVQLAEMPAHREALVSGVISETHADLAVDAARRPSPVEADRGLVETAKGRPADRFARDARQWAARNEPEAKRRDRHDRQRDNRHGSVFVGDDDMTVLHAVLDPVTGEAIQAAVDAEVDRLWRADGGRDGTPDSVRTPAQRRADAIANLIVRQGNSTARPHPRYLAHLRVTVDPTDPDDPFTGAEFIDGTPVAGAVLARLLRGSAIAGAVFATDGSVLWQGRSKRLATDDQWIALVDRDGGCFCCGAPPSHCEAHHVDHWNDLGTTDIDKLVLVCATTHHLVHDHGWVVQRHDDRWHLIAPGEGRAPPEEMAA